MKEQLLNWFLKNWFKITIKDVSINEEYIRYFSRQHLETKTGTLKSRFAFEKFKYLSIQYKEIYGEAKAAEFGSIFIKELDVEIKKSNQIIEETMARFYKDL